MKRREDAYGQMHVAALDGRSSLGTIERDDGFFEVSGVDQHFAPFRRWPACERQGMRFVRGRVLDVGCGAGRACLHLQERGCDVVGIDNSPGAVEVSRRRGVRDARVRALEEIGPSLGSFDTILMYGNNLGLLGSPRRARRILERLHELTSDEGRIVGSTLDPYSTDDPAHLAYHERNRRRGRPRGQVRIRVRYRDLVTPWFDLLWTSTAELEAIVDGTGWRLTRTLGDSAVYVAVIDKCG